MKAKIGVPPFEEMHEVFYDEEKAKIYLIQNDILRMQIPCPYCGILNNWNLKNKSIRCTRYNCHKSYSVLLNTFFENAKLPLNKILLLAYLWILRMPVTSAVEMCNISNQSACDYYEYFENLVADEISDTIGKIGGQNVIVEIDESKFGSRKYYRGHHVEGTWIVGGVERTPERKLFAVAVEDRSTDTIKYILENYVEPGSQIFTDYWKSYDTAITEINFVYEYEVFTHHKINHSETFVAENGDHTNTIEGTWNGMKCTMTTTQKGKAKCPIHILTFIWRRQNKGNLWNSFLSSLKNLRLENERLF